MKTAPIVCMLHDHGFDIFRVDRRINEIISVLRSIGKYYKETYLGYTKLSEGNRRTIGFSTLLTEFHKLNDLL